MSTQLDSLFLCETTHLITEDDIVLHPAEEDQIQSHIDHP